MGVLISKKKPKPAPSQPESQPSQPKPEPVPEPEPEPEQEPSREPTPEMVSEEEEEEELEEEQEEEEEQQEEPEKEREEEENEEEKESGNEEVVEYSSDVASELLKGVIDINIPSQARIVRIFTSSTFTDTFNERNALMVKVYPKLKEYCQSTGYDFQVVDMRWGVRDEATADHMTSELCMKELKLCQDISTGPSFVTFLSHKYGYRPFPPKIVATEFEAMFKVVEEQSDKDLLQKWFLKDENIIPTTYVLQPITDLLPNYGNHNVSKEERGKASGEWWAAFEQMQVVFREAADKVFKGKPNIRWKYFQSVTEDEIQRGILKSKDAKSQCHWFYRNIQDLRQNIDDKAARNFIDKLGQNLDDEAVGFTEDLKATKIPGVLPQENINTYDIQWSAEHGVNPEASDVHKKYIEQLCDDFYRILVVMIDNGIKERKAADIDDELVKEICQHSSMCKEKSRIFQGRQDIIDQIISYIGKEEEDEENRTTLVVYGESGCGKTSIMAKAAALAKQEYPDHIQVTRFLGTTADSSTISRLLNSICNQLQRSSQLPIDAAQPQSFKDQVELLENIIEKMDDSELPCILFLDSIDQLSPDDGAYLMKWLPKKLPKQFKIIISALPDEKYNIINSLKGMVPAEGFIEVTKLPTDTANDILNAWLVDSKRQLTTKQNEMVMNSFNQAPLPLFLKLAFDQATKWKSYQPMESISLEKNVKDSINRLFSDLERMHGKYLVSHALGLITASKHGLSDAEMDDLLSIDDEVLNDVYQYWVPPVRRIPSLLWIRIRNDLGSYIIYRGASGVLVNNWYHRQFIETATERYLSTDQKKNFHTIMADYFLGKWSGGAKKGFTDKSGKDGEEDRLVAAQPNKFQAKDDTEVFNYRKLSELPRHLIESDDLVNLKKHVLFDFDFLLCKLRAFGYQPLYEDVSEARLAYPQDKDIKMLSEILKISSRTLLIDPMQFPTQLYGRLDSENLSPDIKRLLDDASNSGIPCFIPNKICFETPGGSLLNTLAGHTGMVEHASFTQDGKRLLSVGADSTLRIWDLESGTQIRSTQLETAAMAVHSYNDDKCALAVSYGSLVAIDLQTDEIYYDEYHTAAYGKSSDISPNRQRLVMCNDEEMFIFNTSDVKPVLMRSEKEKAKQDPTGFQDIMMTANETFAYTRGNKEEIYIRKYDEEKYKKTIKLPHGLVFFSFTPDGNQLVVLVCPDGMQVAYKKVILLLIDVSSGNITKEIKSKDSHTVLMCYDAQVHQTAQGLEIVWPTLMQINFWNIETGQERMALKSGYQGNQYKQAIPDADGRLVIVPMDSNNTPLQVYDLAMLDYTVVDDSYAQRSDIEKAVAYMGEGEREMYPNKGCPEIGISIPPMEPIMKVWNLKTRTLIKQFRAPDNIFPNSILLLDDNRALAWEWNKRKIFAFDFMEEKQISVSDLTLPQTTSPSAYSNLWIHVKQTDELVTIVDDSNDLVTFDLKTGKNTGAIKTGWKNKTNHMIGSADGAIIVSRDYNANDYTGNTSLDVYNTIEKKHLGRIERDTPFDLSPNYAVLTGDGKYLVTSTQDLQAIEIYEISKLPQMKLKITLAEDEENDSVSLMGLSAINEHGGIVLVSASGQFYKNEEYNMRSLIVAYDLTTGQKLGEKDIYGYPWMFQFSSDYNHVMTDVRPGGDHIKCLDLFDISKLRSEGKIDLVASLKPETDARFNYLAPDGKTLCLGLAGIDGVTFFNVCQPKKEDS